LEIGRTVPPQGGEWIVTGLERTFVEARRHLQRVVEQLESVQLQLLGIRQTLPEPAAEGVRHLDMTEESEPTTELRTTIACVLDDDIRPALADLRDVLATTAPAKEES